MTKSFTVCVFELKVVSIFAFGAFGYPSHRRVKIQR